MDYAMVCCYMPCFAIDVFVIRPINRALGKRGCLGPLAFEVLNLEYRNRKLRELVEEARGEGREISQFVSVWLAEAEGLIAECRQFLEEYETLAQKRCFIGLCPNFRARYQLNYKAENAAMRAFRLCKVAEEFDGVEKISHLVIVRSREIIVQQVVDDLTVFRKSKLGVYGMGGSGKTTLVNVVAGKVMKNKSFDFVVLCNVTAVQNIPNIQKEIIEKLGLEIKEETPDARATRLLGELEKMLKEKKKILFVLDDLWRKLKLEAVGIPSPYQHKGCQILMTSRQRQVLSTEMGCDNNVIDIGLLSDGEAWELFKKMLGSNFENNDALLSKAHEVANVCARLPIAIVTVARALRNNNNLADWETALLNLQRPCPSNFSKVQEGDPAIGEDVHKSIYLSYKLLASDELRSTLLLCSQLLNNSSIRDLLRYSWSLRLLADNRLGSVEEAQNLLRSLVGQLQASCLLLDTGSNERIALHDVVRVITQAIGSEEHHVFTKSPTNDELFHEDNSSSDSEVPDSIFKGKQCLKVVSLTNFSFPLSLPSSLQLLKENLGMLCLDGSSLEDTAIALIGELKNLEILSFAKCKIRCLPEEMGELKKLKILDLSDCSKLEVVPRDVISRLSLLEELYMGNSFSGWGKEGGAEASLAEVRMLHHLTNLEIAIPDAGVMVENLFPQGLKRYRVTIGTDEWWDESYETLSKLLRISLDTSISFGLYGIQMLLFDEKNVLPMLEELELVSINMKTLWHGPFEAVKSSIQNLRRLSVGHCDNLKYLFTSSMVGCFVQLEYLSVRDCDQMEEIILTEEVFRGEEGRINENVIVFSKLDALYLWALPNLKRFCTASLLECPRLKKIKLWKCHALKTFVFNSCFENKSVDAVHDEDLKEKQHEKNRPLFDEKVSFPSLAEMEIEHLDNLENIWNKDSKGILSFGNLQSVTVSGCRVLKNIFPSSMAKDLTQLEDLKIKDCAVVEEIVAKDKTLQDNLCFKFSKLSSLTLKNLPKLQNFYRGQHTSEWPVLKDLEVTGCIAVKLLFTKSSVSEQVHGDGHLENQSQQTVRWWKQDIELGKGQEMAQDDLTISSRQLTSNLNASQDQAGLREKLPFSSNKPTTNIETAKGEMDLPPVESQKEAWKDLCASENLGFNRDLRQEIETTSEVIIEEQARKDTLKTPETAQYASKDIFSSAILNDKDPTGGQISLTLENQEPNGSVLVQKDPQASADNDPLKDQAIASPVSARSTAEQGPMSASEHPSRTTSCGEPTCSVYHPTSEASSASVVKTLSSPRDFESLFAGIEKLLHSSPASTFHGALTECNDSSDDARADSSSGSVDMLKKILAKTMAEVDDGLLSRPTLENLKKQIERTATEFPNEDDKNGIAELRSLYEGSAVKISTLDAREEELEKRLKEIKEEKYQVLATMQDLYEKLVERKGEPKKSMDALREAARQE